METTPRMKHTPEEVLDFLRRNGVKKVRQVGEEFKFLTTIHGEIKPLAFFRYLRSEIAKERPESKQVFGYRKPRRWETRIEESYSSQSIRKTVMKRVFATEEDRQKNAECDARIAELGEWWNDVQELFTLVKYDALKIPSDLAVVAHQGRQLMASRVKMQSRQDPLKDRLGRALKDAGFSRGKRVPREDLYRIAREIGITGIDRIKSLDDFKPGQTAYQLGYKYTSELGYSRKRRRQIT